jgi:iron complex outermembrane receptor protein
MFKKTHIASAILMAVSCQLAYAQEQQDTQSEADDIEVIQVSGIRGSLNKGLNIKRQSFQVVDAIVAEDIGKFPDNNVVEALQRVTGIQVTDRGAGEVNTVSIRGLTDVTTTVNGRQIFTAAGRSVALADIPAALLESVDVYKTRSASQVGSGIAGQIDIKTQRPFNFDGSKVVVSARGIYQEQAEELDPNMSVLASNRWESNIGEFGALVNVSYGETNYRDQNIAAGAMVPFMTLNPAAGFGPLERIQTTDGRVSEELIWQPGLENGLPFQSGSTLNINGVPTEYYLSRDAVFASDFTGKRERPAANIALQWRPNDDSQYTFEAFYNGFRNESFNALSFTFVDWWGNVDTQNPPVTFDGTNIIKERYVDAPYGFNSGDLTVSKTDSYVFALGGEWTITDNFNLASEIYYQDSQYETDFLAMRSERVAYGLNVDFNDKGGIPSLEYADNPDTAANEADLADTSQWNVAQLYDNGGTSKGDALTFTLDGDLFVDNFGFDTVSFGVRYDSRGATDSSREAGGGILGQPLSSLDEGLASINEGFFDGNANWPSSWVVPNGHYIYNNRASFRELYGINADDVVLEKTFDIDETSYAAYVQGNFSTSLFGLELDGQLGLRYEHAKADMTFFDIDQNPTAVSSAENSSSALLPSIVLRYHLSEDVIARAAYTETIRRPDFSQLNSFIYYTEDVTNIGYGTASGGNPDLKPVESQNYDLTLEWYFSDDGSLYGTLFKREIEGFVYGSNRIVQYQGPDDEAPYPYILNQPDNSSNGTLDGLELGLVYFPDNLPDWLMGAGIQASATFLDSEQELPVYEDGQLTGYDKRDMFGVSKSSYSTVLIYERDDFDMRLAYVWRDDFLNNYEAAQFANPLGVYRRPEQSLDFQLSYDINEDFMVTFDGTNLTEEIAQTYYEYPTTHNSNSALFSRTFALGIRYSF